MINFIYMRKFDTKNFSQYVFEKITDLTIPI
jgi:hypothetical protein